MRAAFDKAYSALYGRTIPHLGIEILKLDLDAAGPPRRTGTGRTGRGGAASRQRPHKDAQHLSIRGLGKMVEAGVHLRSDLCAPIP